MTALMIRDLEPDCNLLAVDLRHVLTALGTRALSSRWRSRGVWAVGDAAPDLADSHGDIPGERLAELADRVSQVIDGEFTAYDPEQTQPWVVVEAVDSTYYTVRSEESSVLARIRASFHDVTEYDHPAD